MNRCMLTLLAALAPAAAALADGEPPPVALPTFTGDGWTYELTPEGTINRRYVALNNLEELEELVRRARAAEERRRAERGVEPNTWRVIYALCPDTDMIYVDRDGTRYRQVAGMGTDELAWALLSEQQYYDCAYAYSRGNLRIEATNRLMTEPLLGEYRETCFFWPRDWPDLGLGLDVQRYDSLIGHYFPGPTRPWARGGTGGEGDWMAHLGHTSVQFAPGREKGGPVTDLSVITLHEWLHQIAYFPGTRSGYTGLPTQYDPGNLHGGSHLYWMHDVLTPRMWRTVHTQIPMWSPPNKPRDRFAGFVDRWLVAGVFDLPPAAATRDNMIPPPEALDLDFIDVAGALPDAQAPAAADGAVRWQVLERAWRPEHYCTNLTRLRSALPSPHRDSLAYAHVYVRSPQRREAILWLTGREPLVAWLNGHRVLRCWGGVAEDEASRRVVLLPGWNRLLLKTLDQESPDWWLAARFTDPDHNALGDLEYAAARPDGPIVATADAAPPPPIAIRHYRWADVCDDWFGLLPILTEQHLEALLGAEGVRLLGPPLVWNTVPLEWYFYRRWLMVDVSGVPGVQSRTVPPDCALATLEHDALLNNVLNLARRNFLLPGSVFWEGLALVRYRRPEGGSGDLVLVRADLVEPFMNLARYPDGWTGPPHSERLIGFICRDTKTYFCFDTNLGDPLPANELDVLRARDGTLTLAAGADVPRVVRGQPCRLTRRIVNESAAPVAGEVVIRAAGAAEPLARSRFTLAPGAADEAALPLETAARPAGTLTLHCTVRYTAEGDAERTLEKPVLIPVFDAVGVKVRVDGAELLLTPEQTLVVTVTNNLGEPVRGRVAPVLPAGWQVQPAAAEFSLDRLDEWAEFRFAVRVPPEQPDGALWLAARATLAGRTGPPAEGGVHVSKRFDPVLLRADFEEGIDGDFGCIYQGLYDVQLWRNDPAEGRACLQISDRGGQRFGHVYAFGKHTFRPAEIVPFDTEYTYDTRLYPRVEFWFKMLPESRYDNLGLSVVLDDTENGYGVLINGVWEQQWAPKVMIGRVEGFVADGQWHHVVIDLDRMLDAYLGDTSHHVKELYLGDTRSFSSGWWPDYRHHAHYLDDFRICRDPGPAAAPAEATPGGLPRYSRTHRVPAFESAEQDGLKATLRFAQLGYLPWEEPTLQLWLSNRGDRNIRIATWERTRRWQVRITAADGTPVTDGWVNACSAPPRAAETAPEGRPPAAQPGEPHAAEHFKVLKPGETHREELPLGELFDAWAAARNVQLQRGQEYTVQVRYANGEPGTAWGPAAWTGAVESNASGLMLLPVPTPAEELEALATARDWQRRAKAAAQLGKHKHRPAIPALAAAARQDPNDDVRLNAVWALGEMGRVEGGGPATGELAPAVAALLAALEDANWRVAEYAGMSLGRLGDRQATAALVARLEDPSKWVRRRSVNALAELADPAALPELAARLDDVSREVRREAVAALVGYCDRRIEPLSRPAGDAAAEPGALAAARAEFAEAYEALLPALHDEYWVVRRAAVEALPRYAAGADVLPLVLAALDDPHDGVREGALAALGGLHRRAEAAGQLDELRARSAGAAGRLTELLGDYYTPVRERAVEVFADVLGRSIVEATGRTADEWRRQFPRPGDPRSPQAGPWEAQQARERAAAGVAAAGARSGS